MAARFVQDALVRICSSNGGIPGALSYRTYEHAPEETRPRLEFCNGAERGDVTCWHISRRFLDTWSDAGERWVRALSRSIGTGIEAKCLRPAPSSGGDAGTCRPQLWRDLVGVGPTNDWDGEARALHHNLPHPPSTGRVRAAVKQGCGWGGSTHGCGGVRGPRHPVDAAATIVT